jgi:hypothetical protein
MKMNIRKQAALAVAAAFAFSAFMPTLSAAPLASGNLVTIADGPGAGPGGEFILTYATGSFASFCLEKSEFLNFGPSYIATFNNAAIAGGGVLANAGLGDVAGTAGVSDPLSNATAWVYSNYLEGTLSGQVVGSAASADKAQDAIWFLENEGGANNTWAQAAITAVNNGWVNPTGGGHVYVLNLTDQAGGLHQDQLYMAPVPEPETYAMLLAGLGLMGFVARRRKRLS